MTSRHHAVLVLALLELEDVSDPILNQPQASRVGRLSTEARQNPPPVPYAHAPARPGPAQARTGMRRALIERYSSTGPTGRPGPAWLVTGCPPRTGLRWVARLEYEHRHRRLAQ